MDFSEIIKSLKTVVEDFRFAFAIAIAAPVWYVMDRTSLFGFPNLPEPVQYSCAYGIGAMLAMVAAHILDVLSVHFKKERRLAKERKQHETMKGIFDGFALVQVETLERCLRIESRQFRVIPSIDPTRNGHTATGVIYSTASPIIQDMLNVRAITVAGEWATINSQLWDWLGINRVHVAERSSALGAKIANANN